MLDVESLVEDGWDVESQGALAVVDRIAGSGSHLLFGLPAAGRKGVFQLVTIIEDIVAARDRTHGGGIDSAESFKVVLDLLVFVLKLRLVVHVLPLAATADTEMGAAQFLAKRRGLA